MFKPLLQSKKQTRKSAVNALETALEQIIKSKQLSLKKPDQPGKASSTEKPAEPENLLSLKTDSNLENQFNLKNRLSLEKPSPAQPETNSTDWLSLQPINPNLAQPENQRNRNNQLNLRNQPQPETPAQPEKPIQPENQLNLEKPAQTGSGSATGNQSIRKLQRNLRPLISSSPEEVG